MRPKGTRTGGMDDSGSDNINTAFGQIQSVQGPLGQIGAGVGGKREGRPERQSLSCKSLRQDVDSILRYGRDLLTCPFV